MTIRALVFIGLVGAFTFVTVTLCSVKFQLWWSDRRERKERRTGLYDRRIR